MNKLTQEQYAALSDKDKTKYKDALFSALLEKGVYYPSSVNLKLDLALFTFNKVKISFQKKFSFLKRKGQYGDSNLGKLALSDIKIKFISENEATSITNKLDKTDLIIRNY